MTNLMSKVLGLVVNVCLIVVVVAATVWFVQTIF